jgi:hypothetical protein
LSRRCARLFDRACLRSLLDWARRFHRAHLDLGALYRAWRFDRTRLLHGAGLLDGAGLFNGPLRLDRGRSWVRRLEPLRLIEIARRFVGPGFK